MLWLLQLAIALGGCSWASLQSPQAAPAPGIALSEKAEEARAQLLNEIPPGTDLATAEKHLTSLGFKFSKHSPDECFARLDKQKNSWITTSWMVKIHGEQQKVRDTTVEVAYTGP